MTTVVEAEQQLNAARAAEASARREAAEQEVVQLRREGAALLKRFRPMVRQIRDAEAERLKLNALLVQAKNQVAYYSVPLDPLTFPTDEEVAAHEAQLAAWKAKQQELLAQSADVRSRESIRMQAVVVQARLRHLHYAIQNLSAIAEGRRPGEVEGGLFKGVEDFLGRSDRRFS